MQFIVIEGLDGSGKSTVTKLLAQRFADLDLPCHRTFEPTKNQVGTLIRSILSGESAPVSNDTMALLFVADRQEHVYNEILPVLMAGNYVVCDRYSLSNMAYQGLDDEYLERVVHYNHHAISYVRPDITFFINVTPAECIKRIEKRGGDKSIYETLEGLKSIYKRYMAAINRMKKTDHIVIVGNDTVTPQEIVAEIWTHIKPADV